MYGRLVGGGPVHFTANYWRFHEIDFIEASKKGTIAGTGFADWPITYADLEPYYTKAEWDLGVSGLAGASPFDPPRSKPYPLPPMPVKSTACCSSKARASWAIIPSRLRWRSSRRPTRAAWPASIADGARASAASMAPSRARCRRWFRRPLRPGKLRDQAAQLRAQDRYRRQRPGHRRDLLRRAQGREDAARQGCRSWPPTAPETPRLLLLSKSNRFPDGLANSSGLVGKYLMFNTDPMAAGLFEHELNGYKSIEVTRIMQDFYEIDPKLGFYGGGGISARFQNYPITFAFGGLAAGSPTVGQRIQEGAGEVFHSHHDSDGPWHIAAGGEQQHLARRHGER